MDGNVKKMEILNLKPNSPRNNRLPNKKRIRKDDPKPECVLRVQGEYLKRLNPSDAFRQFQEEQLNRISVNNQNHLFNLIEIFVHFPSSRFVPTEKLHGCIKKTPILAM